MLVKRALKVLRRLPAKHGLGRLTPPEVAQQMLDHLARLKEQGIEAIKPVSAQNDVTILRQPGGRPAGQ